MCQLVYKFKVILAQVHCQMVATATSALIYEPPCVVLVFIKLYFYQCYSIYIVFERNWQFEQTILLIISMGKSHQMFFKT